MFKLFRTEKFIKKFNKLDNSIKIRFERQFKILEINPFIGRPLKSRWFRELKVENYRIYYLIKEQKVSILLLDTSNKKGQQEIINQIYPKLREYLELI